AELSIMRKRSVGNGFHEELSVLNHSAKPVDLDVRIEVGADFADLFEVKDALPKKGKLSRRTEDGQLILGYQRDTFVRETRISSSAPAKIDEQGLRFAVHLKPHGSWKTELDVQVVIPTMHDQAGSAQKGEMQRGGAHTQASRTARGAGHNGQDGQKAMRENLDRWLAAAPRLTCSWEPLETTYARSIVDLAALRFMPRM